MKREVLQINVAGNVSLACPNPAQRLTVNGPYEYVYSWGPRWKRWPASSPLKQLCRLGQPCRVLARGAMNSALIEFQDGAQAVVSRNALRKCRLTGQE